MNTTAEMTLAVGSSGSVGGLVAWLLPAGVRNKTHVDETPAEAGWLVSTPLDLVAALALRLVCDGVVGRIIGPAIDPTSLDSPAGLGASFGVA
jgi:hypothetical protein